MAYSLQHGLRHTVSSMARGLQVWRMIYSMAYDLWPMIYSMAYDLWPMADSKPPTMYIARPIA